MKDVGISARAPSSHPIITTRSLQAGCNDGESAAIPIDLTESPRHRKLIFTCASRAVFTLILESESPRPEDLQNLNSPPVVQAHAEITLPVATPVDLTGQSAREIRDSPPLKRLKISTTAPAPPLHLVDTDQNLHAPASSAVVWSFSSVPKDALTGSIHPPALGLVDTGRSHVAAPASSLVVSFSSVPQGIPTTSTHRPVTSARTIQHSRSAALRDTNDVAARRSGKRKRVEEAPNNVEPSSSQSSWSWWRQGDVRWPSPSETRPWRREATKEELQDIDIRRYWEEDWARARQRRNSSLWNSQGAIQQWIEKCRVDSLNAQK